MIRIGELQNGDLYVPTPAEHASDGTVNGGLMRRVVSGSKEHQGWMREVETGRVELVRRDRSRSLSWIDEAEPSPPR